MKLARLCVAAFFSETGEWMMQIALPILVYQATGSVSSTAAMMIVGLVPAVLVSPVAGVLADRIDRRLLLLAVCLGQLLVATPLLFDAGTSWLVMAGQASLAAFFEPARNALVPEVSDNVNAANGFLSAGANVARLVGAWLGGTLFAVGGVTAVYVGYAAALVLAACALLPRLGGKPVPSKRSPARDWLDGLVAFRRVWTVGVVLTLMSVSQGMFLVQFVPFVLDTLTAGAGGVGLLRGVQAIGGLAAGFAVAALARRLAPERMLGWGAVAFGILSALIWHGPAVTTALGVYIGLFVAVGVPGVVANSGLLSVLQTAVPRGEIGRVLSTAFAVMALGTAAGMLLAGLADGAGFLLDAQAGLYVVAGVVALAHQHRHRLRDARLARSAGREPAKL